MYALGAERKNRHAPGAPATSHGTRLVRAALAVLTMVAVLVAAPQAAHADDRSDERAFLAATNASRAQYGLGALGWDENAANIARGWSGYMASAHSLVHNPDLVGQISNYEPNWRRIGENIGYGGSVSGLQTAF